MYILTSIVSLALTAIFVFECAQIKVMIAILLYPFANTSSFLSSSALSDALCEYSHPRYPQAFYLYVYSNVFHQGYQVDHCLQILFSSRISDMSSLLLMEQILRFAISSFCIFYSCSLSLYTQETRFTKHLFILLV